jgi:hypothetical protein
VFAKSEKDLSDQELGREAEELADREKVLLLVSLCTFPALVRKLLSTFREAGMSLSREKSKFLSFFTLRG